MNSISSLEQLCKTKNITCLRDEPLRAHCTFKIGGAAALFIEPKNGDEIETVILAASGFGVPLVTLGNGSNILFSDEGISCAVLHLGGAFSKMRLLDGATIECESGASLKSLCEFARENGLSGLEFAYGIPGSVGGAIYMNAGAYGGEIKDALIGSRHVSEAGHGEFSGEALDFSYRHSVYTGREFIITHGIFRLQKADIIQIRAKMDDFMSRRREKQPLEFPSAGSTFQRPDGGYASALIDQCGLKGRRVGGAMVSEKHAGFVINAGGATCADVLALIEIIRDEVREKTGFSLQCEVKIIKG